MRVVWEVIERGDIKRYREHLNAQDISSVKWRNGARGQQTRPYGDYLYTQDHDKFMFDLQEWLAEKQHD